MKTNYKIDLNSNKFSRYLLTLKIIIIKSKLLLSLNVTKKKY